MSPIGTHGISSNTSISSVQNVPTSEHATSIIDTTHIYNPYTNRYQPRITVSLTQPSKSRQTYFRSPDNDHYFWVGDDMSQQPNNTSTRLVFHSTNGIF